MEWYEIWLLIGFATFIFDITSNTAAFGDVITMAQAHPSKIVAYAGVVAIFSFAILLGPINTVKTIYDRYKWRQFKKRFPNL